MTKKKKKKPKTNRPKFKVFTLEYTGRWTWLLEASNGKIYAQCGRSYRSKRGCVKAIEAIQNMASKCEIVVDD